MDNLKNKSESLAEKMNNITAKFTENLELADDMEIVGDDIIDYIQEKQENIQLYTEEVDSAVVINLNNMVDDFKFVRETLKENTENGRKVLNAVTLDLLDTDDDKRAQLILSFAELNKAVADNMKLYMQSYKDISNVLLNLDKIKKGEETNTTKTINNTVNVTTTEVINTTNLIKKLKGE